MGTFRDRAERMIEFLSLSLSLSLLIIAAFCARLIYTSVYVINKRERGEILYGLFLLKFIHFASFHQTNNEQIFFFFFFGGDDENDGIRSPSVGTSKKNKKDKRERDLAKNVRGGVRFAKAWMSVLSRRNPSSERDREEIKRYELRVTLRSERIHRRGSDGV